MSAEVSHGLSVIRRVFLKTAAGAGAVSAAAAATVGLRSSTELPAPARPLYVLDAPAFGVLAVVAGRVLVFPGADPIDVAHRVDAVLRYATPEARSELDLALALIENALSGLLLRGSATLFSELEPEAQDRALERWGRSSIAQLRGAVDAIRKLCLGAHYAPIAAQAEVGHPGPPVDPPKPAPISPRAPLSPPWRLAAFEGESP